MGPMVGVAKLEQQFEERYADRSIPGWQESTHKEKLFCLPTSKLLKSEATRKSHMTGQLYKKRLVEAVEAEDKRIARLESHAAKWHDLLSDTIQETVQHLQKKQSQTVEEMEAEKDDDSDDGVDVDDGGVDVDPDEMQDDEDRPIYNPLNLPLGWQAYSLLALQVARVGHRVQVRDLWQLLVLGSTCIRHAVPRDSEHLAFQGDHKDRGRDHTLREVEE